MQSIEASLEDPSPRVRAHAAFSIVHADPSLSSPERDPRIAKLFVCDAETGCTARIAVLDAVLDHGDARWADFILSMTAAPDPEVMEHAAMAMARVKDLRFIPRLVERLDMREGRAAIRAALVGMGEPALDALEHALFDDATNPRCRRHIPRAIAQFGTQRAADILTVCLTRPLSGTIRYKALRGLCHLVRRGSAITFDRKVIEAELLRNLVEHLRTTTIALLIDRGVEGVRTEARSSGSLVVGLLRDKAQQALERAFRLLQIAHPREDLRRIYLALGANDPRVRAYAQEFLSVLANGRRGTERMADACRELLRIVSDDLPHDERARRAAPLLPKLPASYLEALSELLRENTSRSPGSLLSRARER